MNEPFLYSEQEALIAQLRAQLKEKDQELTKIGHALAKFEQQRDYYRVEAEQAALLEVRVGELDAECMRYHKQNTALLTECDDWQEKALKAEAERDYYRAEAERMTAEREQDFQRVREMEQSKAAAWIETERSWQRQVDLRLERNSLKAERDHYKQQCEQYLKERDELLETAQEISDEPDALREKFNLGYAMAREGMPPSSLAAVIRDLVSVLVAERDEANRQWEIGGKALAENDRLRAALEAERDWWKIGKDGYVGPRETDRRIEKITKALEGQS